MIRSFRVRHASDCEHHGNVQEKVGAVAYEEVLGILRREGTKQIDQKIGFHEDVLHLPPRCAGSSDLADAGARDGGNDVCNERRGDVSFRGKRIVPTAGHRVQPIQDALIQGAIEGVDPRK